MIEIKKKYQKKRCGAEKQQSEWHLITDYRWSGWCTCADVGFCCVMRCVWVVRLIRNQSLGVVVVFSSIAGAAEAMISKRLILILRRRGARVILINLLLSFLLHWPWGCGINSQVGQVTE